MNFSQGHSGTKVQCESCLFSQGKTPEFTKKGEIHELFVLALSLVWFAEATPDKKLRFAQMHATPAFIVPPLARSHNKAPHENLVKRSYCRSLEERDSTTQACWPTGPSSVQFGYSLFGPRADWTILTSLLVRTVPLKRGLLHAHVRTALTERRGFLWDCGSWTTVLSRPDSSSSFSSCWEHDNRWLQTKFPVPVRFLHYGKTRFPTEKQESIEYNSSLCIANHMRVTKGGWLIKGRFQKCHLVAFVVPRNTWIYSTYEISSCGSRGFHGSRGFRRSKRTTPFLNPLPALRSDGEKHDAGTENLHRFESRKTFMNHSTSKPPSVLRLKPPSP